MFSYPKRKLSEAKEFVKTHPKETVGFAVGVISTVAALKFRDRNNTVLVMKTREFENVCKGMGIYEFTSKAGSTTLISSNYIKKTPHA